MRRLMVSRSDSSRERERAVVRATGEVEAGDRMPASPGDTVSGTLGGRETKRLVPTRRLIRGLPLIIRFLSRKFNAESRALGRCRSG